MAQTQVANYTMEAFVEDVNEVFRNEADPHMQAKKVSAHLKDLLAVPGWVEEKLELAEEGGFGRFSLHLDEESGHPGNGWWLMVSVQKPGQDNLPHDHGVTWEWTMPRSGKAVISPSTTATWPTSCPARFTTPSTSKKRAVRWWCA